MKVRLLLANFAEVRDKLLYVVSGGWTLIGPRPTPFAIAALVEVEWNETNRPLNLLFDIVDVDGQPFQVPTPTGDQPFKIGAEVNFGRPPDAVPGEKFLMPVAINFQPLPFEPGRQYVVRAFLDGTPMDETGFRVRPQPAGAQRK